MKKIDRDALARAMEMARRIRSSPRSLTSSLKIALARGRRVRRLSLPIENLKLLPHQVPAMRGHRWR